MRAAITRSIENLRNSVPTNRSTLSRIEGSVGIEEDRTQFVWFIVAAMALHAAVFVGSRVQASGSREARLVEIEMIALAPPAPPVPAATSAVAAPLTSTRAVRVERRAGVAPQTVAVAAPIAAPSTLPSTEIAATGNAIPSAEPAGEAGPIASSTAPASLEPSANAVPTGIDVRGLTRGWFGELNSYFGGRALRAYPRAAQREGLEGIVLIALVIDEQGRVHSVRVKRSSGHSVLDEAALSSVRALNGAPAPPGEIHWGAREISLPIDYRLN